MIPKTVEFVRVVYLFNNLLDLNRSCPKTG